MRLARRWNSMEIRSKLEEFLGEPAFKALEYHLKKVLGDDPYQDPEKLREGLRLILGQSGEVFFEKILSD